MKPIPIIVTLTLAFAPILVSAAQQALTFQWQKPTIEPDLAAFHLQYSTDAKWTLYENNHNPDSGTWTDLITIPFKIEKSVYEETTPIKVNDDEESFYYFRIRALDTAGNPSPWNYGTETQPCEAYIDLKPPEVIIQLTVFVERHE